MNLLALLTRRQTYQVYFSPRGGCRAAVLEAVAAARKELLVMAYCFTSQVIASEVLAAAQRKVKVEVLVDDKAIFDRGNDLRLLVAGGVPVYSDGKHGLMHDKVMVIDRKTVFMGSYNWTDQAEERNAENLLVVRNTKLAALYAANFELHRAHSTILAV